MEYTGLASGRLCQVAFVVEDIEKASKAWAAALGVDVPKWSITDVPEKARTLYQGKPTEGRAKLAFLKAGQMDIELIEPVGGPSTWRDGLGTGGMKLHHVAFWVPDAETATKKLGEQGMKVVQTGEFTGGHYVYIDGVGKLGAVLELLASRP